MWHCVVTLAVYCSTNMPIEKITTALEGAKAAGIDNIVALRGGECSVHESFFQTL